jgi:hypothetical protein
MWCLPQLRPQRCGLAARLRLFEAAYAMVDYGSGQAELELMFNTRPPPRSTMCRATYFIISIDAFRLTA